MSSNTSNKLLEDAIGQLSEDGSTDTQGKSSNAESNTLKKKARKLAKGLNKSSSAHDIEEAVNALALANFSPVEEGEILQSIKNKTKSPIGALRKQLNLEKKQLNPDKEHIVRTLCHKIIEHLGNGNLIFKGGFFYVWKDTGVWQLIDKIEIEKLTTQFIPPHEDYKANLLTDTIRFLAAKCFLKQELNNLQGEFVLNLINGELWLNKKIWKWELKPHKKEHYFTNQIPINYDPDARAKFWRKYKFDVFSDYREIILEELAVLHANGISAKDLESSLRESLKNNGNKEFKQKVLTKMIDCIRRSKLLDEMIGYTLLTTTIFEKIFFLQGDPGTGKSTTLKLIEALLGKENFCSVNPAEAGSKFNRVRFANKLACISSEIDEGKEIPGGFYRSLASGDTIEGEFKNKDAFQFNPFCTALIGCNDFPRVRDSRGAFMDRVLILQFNRAFRKPRIWPDDFYETFKNFPERDSRVVEDKLIPELSGILNCALKAIANVIKNNGKFTETNSGFIAKDEWQLENDQILRFLNERCIRDDNMINSEFSEDLFQAYLQWAELNKIKQHLTNSAVFSKRVRQSWNLQEPTDSDRTSKRRKIRGLRLRNSPAAADMPY